MKIKLQNNGSSFTRDIFSRNSDFCPYQDSTNKDFVKVIKIMTSKKNIVQGKYSFWKLVNRRELIIISVLNSNQMRPKILRSRKYQEFSRDFPDIWFTCTLSNKFTHFWPTLPFFTPLKHKQTKIRRQQRRIISRL